MKRLPTRKQLAAVIAAARDEAHTLEATGSLVKAGELAHTIIQCQQAILALPALLKLVTEALKATDTPTHIRTAAIKALKKAGVQS